MSGGALSVQKLASILNMSRREIRELVAEMTDEFEIEERGVRLIEVDNHYQLTTRLKTTNGYKN